MIYLYYAIGALVLKLRGVSRGYALAAHLVPRLLVLMVSIWMWLQMVENLSTILAMQLTTFIHQLGVGWNSAFPDLDSETTLVLVFGSPEYRGSPDAVMELQRAYPRSVVIGCSTAGEVAQHNVNDNSLSVAVAKFSHTPLRSAYADVDTRRSRAAGFELAQQLKSPELKGVFVVSDGLQVNGSDLVQGLYDGLGTEVPVCGGLAADGERFQQTWIVQRDGLVSGKVGAVGFYGERIRLDCGSKGGWQIFGPERKITSAEGNIVYTFDDQSALELYKVYLGEHANDLPAAALLFPLSVRRRPNGPAVVRTILSTDEDRKSMTFAGDMPVGARTQLMRASFDRLIDGAEGAAKMLSSPGEPKESPMLCVLVSCVGRRLVLGERIEEEVEAVLEVLPANAQQIGFYAYGEISPDVSGVCDLHNQTMTLMTIYEQ
ncbi:MAG: FIST C-terminal domain-containing protein [Myxococcales bacterium]|nr:FIST C-terminal domain-containing protein [Myxococcales bacterium]